MKLSLPTHPGHRRLEEVVPTIHDLMAATAERHQVLAAVVGGVIVDMVPVERFALVAPLARFGLVEHAVCLPAANVRVLRLLPYSRLLGDAELSLADRVPDVPRACCSRDGVAIPLGAAGHAVSTVRVNGRPAVCTRLGLHAVLAFGRIAARSVTALGEGFNWQYPTAFATGQRHVNILRRCQDYYCRLARWRTRDPAERARALGVPKPLPVPEGQRSLFDELEAS